MADPWCDACDALLYACESCGRWLSPDVRECPNPGCRGQVIPHLPQHTGRRWDNNGATVGWSWPAEWDRTHPSYAPPRVEEWTAIEEIHAAAVAHGVLYAWMGQNLVSPDRGGVWQALDAARPPGGGGEQIWRCPLGQGGSPCPHLPYAARLMISGGCAVLAGERGYWLAGLRHRGDARLFLAGEPIGQVGGPHGWAGWIRPPDQMRSEGLYSARVTATGDPGEPSGIRLLPGASMATGSRMALSGDRIVWPAASDGRTWQLDLAGNQAQPVTAATSGITVPWFGPRGVHVVKEALGQLSLEIPPAAGRGAGRSVPAGAGPFRGVFCRGDQVLVAGERLVLLDPRTGERRSEALRPPGRWVDGAFAPAADGEPRLLALCMEGDFAVLSAVKVSSGSIDHLWRQYGVRARALLPVGRLLHVVHDRGIVRLRK